MWIFGISSALVLTLYNDVIDLHAPPWVHAVTAFMIITGLVLSQEPVFSDK